MADGIAREVDAPAPEIDLAEWRERQGLTWQQLAEIFGWSGTSQARRIAIGAVQADPRDIERIREVTGGQVGIFALHQRRLAYIRALSTVPPLEIGRRGADDARRA